jgi:hypothetical protein
MFIPVDQLHQYFDTLIDHDLVIYRFWPHGSKEIRHLTLLHQYSMLDITVNPIVICHDQEPLNYSMYTSNQIQGLWNSMAGAGWPPGFAEFWDSRNLRSACEVNIYDRCVLLHSEQRSTNLQQYQDAGFVPVYAWSHGFIARDWYRYAEVDPLLTHRPDPIQDFNIYARAWTGTREYRLKLLAMVTDIAHHCRVTFSSCDTDIHYQGYQFVNKRFDINHTELVDFYGDSEITSNSSATYNVQHYQQCAVDVVTETLFDDDRLHLTEKILRPIACGKPFILVGTWGSLAYLREYGFQTFGNLIDESYDTVQDPVQRLQAIADIMRNIARMPVTQRQQLYLAMQTIADYNRQHFFSDAFAAQLNNEYLANMQAGLRTVKESGCGTEWHQEMALYDQHLHLHSEILDVRNAVEDQLHRLSLANIK